jgi:signal transduction histidine kinase
MAAAPRSREGLLLLLTAVGWFVGTVVAPTTEIGRSEAGRLVGQLWQLHAAFLIHAIATWPSGRVERPTQRPIVVGGYVAALFPQLWVTDPTYVLLGGLLAAGILVDHRSLTPMQRRATAPARHAGLLLAGVIAGLPFLTELLEPLDLALVSTGANLYAVATAVTASLLTEGLVRRSRPGTAADAAVDLGSGTLATTDDVARLLTELVGEDDPGGGAARDAADRAAALMGRNQALRAALELRVAELEASRRRVVEAGDEERRTLVDQLRSGPGERIDSLAVVLRSLAAAPGDDRVTTRLARAGELAVRAADGLATIEAGLDPGDLTARGLVPALRDLATSSPIPVTLALPVSGPTEPAMARTLYFVAAESMANVVRHAQAGMAWLALESDDGGWCLTVEDDGVGGADATKGSGLLGLRERAEAMGGSLRWADRTTGGTRVVATVPRAVTPLGVS